MDLMHIKPCAINKTCTNAKAWAGRRFVCPVLGSSVLSTRDGSLGGAGGGPRAGAGVAIVKVP